MGMPLPMVRLTIEAMQYEIVKALEVHADEMRDTIEEVVADVVKNFDYRYEVGRLAQAAINEAIKREIGSFFGAGGPGGKAIRDALAAKLDRDGSWHV